MPALIKMRVCSNLRMLRDQLYSKSFSSKTVFVFSLDADDREAVAGQRREGRLPQGPGERPSPLHQLLPGQGWGD